MIVRSHLRAAALAVAAGATALTVGACGTPAPAPSVTAAPTTAAPSATVTTATPSSSPTAVATPTASATATASSACSVSALQISYADNPGGGGAGSVVGKFTFTNTSSTSCTLTGFPGVSYATAAGTPIGKAAGRTEEVPVNVTLAAGKKATVVLRRVQPGGYGDLCQQTKAAGFEVTPPGSTESTLVKFATTACRNPAAPLLHVSPALPA